MSRFLDLPLWIVILVLSLVALFVLFMGGMILVVLATCLWEKQRVRDFAPATPDVLPPPSPYFRSMSEYARVLGFQPGGLFGQDRQSSMYRCCLGLWLSPDGKSLLCIAGGKVARVNYKRTMLISKVSGETSIVTMDAFGSEDLSGTRDVEVLMNADLNELNQLHQRRLATARVEPRPFSSDLLAEIEEWNRIRADRLVARGLAKYIDPEHNTWRFTPKGAVLYTVKAQISGLAKASAQRERINITRPGG